MTGAPDNTGPLASAVRRVRRRVLPVLAGLFVLNYLDRVNVGFIQDHLRADLGLDSAAYGLGAGLFFVGYALLEVPSNLVLQRVGARAWLARIAVSWGVVAASMAFVQTKGQFLALRFLLGAAEAGFFPGVLYYLTLWLPAADRGRAVATLLSGSAAAAILSGPLAGALMQIHGHGLAGWRWMLMVEGLASVAAGLMAWRWLDARPRDARWLASAEREALERVVQEEQHERTSGGPEGRGPGRLLLDPQVGLFCVVYFSVQLTIYASTFWLPRLIRDMGKLGDMQVGWLNSIPWALSVVGMMLAAAGAARWRHPRAWLAGALLVAGAGQWASTLGGPVAGFAWLCVAALGFKSASSLFWPIPQARLDARISAAVIALVNSVGNLGGFVAPTVLGWLEKRTGTVHAGLRGLALASALTAAVVFLLRVPTPSMPTRKPRHAT